jgi:hypothetical protein
MLSRCCAALTTLLFAATIQVAQATTATQSIFQAAAPATDEIAARLKAAYPNFVTGIENNAVVFKDGTRIPFDDGKKKAFEAWLGHPDVEDMFRFSYPAGGPVTPPPFDFDPGRARDALLFEKIYGDCRKPSFTKSLAKVAWLPKRSKQVVAVTTINGVAEKLRAVSAELDRLPPRFNVFLLPSAGGYVCRQIAGTNQRSAHGYGIAVDIAIARSHYWRWVKGGAEARPKYRNEIPAEVVAIFEKHGFIWGGRWYHYDTMHFEYRPELLQPK